MVGPKPEAVRVKLMVIQRPYQRTYHFTIEELAVKVRAGSYQG